MSEDASNTSLGQSFLFTEASLGVSLQYSFPSQAISEDLLGCLRTNPWTTRVAITGAALPTFFEVSFALGVCSGRAQSRYASGFLTDKAFFHENQTRSRICRHQGHRRSR
jgi:hypothetical protein